MGHEDLWSSRFGLVGNLSFEYRYVVPNFRRCDLKILEVLCVCRVCFPSFGPSFTKRRSFSQRARHRQVDRSALFRFHIPERSQATSTSTAETINPSDPSQEFHPTALSIMYPQHLTQSKGLRLILLIVVLCSSVSSLSSSSDTFRQLKITFVTGNSMKVRHACCCALFCKCDVDVWLCASGD